MASGLSIIFVHYPTGKQSCDAVLNLERCDRVWVAADMKAPRRLRGGSAEAQRRLRGGSTEQRLRGGFTEAPRRLGRGGGTAEASRSLQEGSAEARQRADAPRGLCGGLRRLPGRLRGSLQGGSTEAKAQAEALQKLRGASNDPDNDPPHQKIDRLVIVGASQQ